MPIYSMITRKSSSKPLTLLPKALTLQIPVQTSPSPPKNPAEAHKIKKSSPNRSPKIAKIENAFESLQLDLLSSTRTASIWNELTSSAKKQGSSYLAYKLEQNALKLMHANKTHLLKNRGLIYRRPPEARQTQLSSIKPSQPRNQAAYSKRLSFITLNGFKNRQEGTDSQPQAKERKIYIKTAQGKRQKICQHEYLSKIQAKSQSKQLLVTSSMEMSQMEIGIERRLSPDFDRKGSRHERLSLLRHFRARSLKKQNKQAKENDDCRPSSSNKSDFLFE